MRSKQAMALGFKTLALKSRASILRERTETLAQLRLSGLRLFLLPKRLSAPAPAAAPRLGGGRHHGGQPGPAARNQGCWGGRPPGGPQGGLQGLPRGWGPRAGAGQKCFGLGLAGPNRLASRGSLVLGRVQAKTPTCPVGRARAVGNAARADSQPSSGSALVRRRGQKYHSDASPRNYQRSLHWG